VNVIERPDGVKIAALFIAAIIATSLVSRVWRQTELRVTGVELEANAQRFVADVNRGDLRLIAYDPEARDAAEYAAKEGKQRDRNRIPSTEQVLFLEVARGGSNLTLHW